jgi:hypothetical protein
MYLYKVTDKRPIHIFQFQKFNILYLENMCYILYLDVFLFKLKILIQWKIWHNDDLRHVNACHSTKTCNVTQKMVHLILHPS